MVWDGKITAMACITMIELMVATTNGHVLRYKWDGNQNRDYNLDLRRIPFCINQQVSKGKKVFINLNVNKYYLKIIWFNCNLFNIFILNYVNVFSCAYCGRKHLYY